jgi:hypothetical protein
MMQTMTGRRLVIIGGTATAASTHTQRETCDRQRATARRIVVIKDGQFVGGRPGR